MSIPPSVCSQELFQGINIRVGLLGHRQDDNQDTLKVKGGGITIYVGLFRNFHRMILTYHVCVFLAKYLMENTRTLENHSI